MVNPLWTEGSLEFDFSGAIHTDQPEKPAQPLKSVDFWARYPGCVWLIEVKDPDGAPAPHHAGAVASILKTVFNDHLLKEHLLPKLYGSYAHLMDTGREPRGPVRYGVLLGLTSLTSADRTVLTNKLQRYVDRIGPKVRHSRHWPIVEVHNLSSWNAAHPEMAITRHA